MPLTTPGGLGGRQKFFCAPYSNRGAADITCCFTKHDICIQENGLVLHLPFLNVMMRACVCITNGHVPF